MAAKRVEIRVSGKVQRVAYRYGAKDEADRLGITGFASNEPYACLPDGQDSVKIVAEGEEEKLQKFIEWAKIGTEWAEVDKIEIECREATGEFQKFSIE